jgi:hypothetical protein
MQAALQLVPLDTPPVILRDMSTVRIVAVDTKRPRLLVRPIKSKDNATRWIQNASIAVHPRLELGRKRLTRFRAWPMARWVPILDPSKAVLVQVGANDHAADHGGLDHTNDDAGPKCVKLQWWSLLIEPTPHAFAALQRRYPTSSSRVSLRQAAVCGRDCSVRSLPFWRVDLHNTSNFGSPKSDGRCAKIAGESDFLSEIASLDRQHLMKHARLFNHMPEACAKCGQRLTGHELPPSCMQHLVEDNLAVESVECLCLSSLLRSQDSVSLLLVDAEGRDAEVLFQYPWDRLPPARVAFEAMHLSNELWDRTVTLLKSHGYENVMGARQTAWQSVWHRVNSTEVLRSEFGRTL